MIDDAKTEAADLWLELSSLARAEVTSEAPAYPLASVLSHPPGPGWRAQTPGPQTVRLSFHLPHRIQSIEIVCQEETMERTQEFVLRWLPEDAADYREIVRQQYVFSPTGSTRETEWYQVDLSNLVALELRITPDISGKEAYASLASLKLQEKQSRPE